MPSGNINNLVPNEARTPEERRANAAKAGKASGQSRRKKKMLKECFEILLEAKTDKIGKNGKPLTGAEALTLEVFRKAVSGDLKAFELLRDTAGLKPSDKIEIAKIDPEAMDDIEDVFDDDETESTGAAEA